MSDATGRADSTSELVDATGRAAAAESVAAERPAPAAPRAGSTEEPDDEEYAIEVNDVTMIFNIASEQLNNLKEYFIKIMRHELFFKEFRALDHVSFKVRRGEVVGLVGTNGSGKSTMLKCIAGVLEPSEGSIVVRGNIAPLIELGAGFDTELTARENIYLNGALLGYSREFIDEHLQDIIDFAELQDFMDMPLKNYSSGMVARIAFAIATVTEPDVLIVDETLSVGDVFFQQKCEDRIRSFIESGRVTVLFVSHSLAQVARICDRAIWIEKGTQRMDGPTKEVCAAYRAQFEPVPESPAERTLIDRLVPDTPDLLLRQEGRSGRIPERSADGRENGYYAVYTGMPIEVPGVRYEVRKGSTYFYTTLDPSLYSVVSLRDERGRVVREAVQEGTYTVEIDLADHARVRYNLEANTFSFTVRKYGHFADVNSAAWYSLAIERAYNLYYLDDTQSNLFYPEREILGEELLGLMMRMAGEGAEKDADALAWAKDRGILDEAELAAGFSPEGAVAREGFAHMLANFARWRGSYVAPSLDVLSDIDDLESVSEWALEDVAWAVANKVMGKGGLVNGGGAVTRAEAVTMAVNFQPESPDGHDRVTNPRP